MKAENLDRIREAGVVGAGGAGFPTHVKLSAEAETLIVNACECEPLIRVDQLLLQHYLDEVLKGTLVARELTCAQKVIIAIKAKHKSLVQDLKQRTEALDGVKVHEIGDYYPAGDEHILVYDTTAKVVPPGDIPLAVGTVVSNVETMLNVARAQKCLPVTTTFVTVSGAVPTPVTCELPLGLSYREAIALCGTVAGSDWAVIDGGPMMGKLVPDLDAPITKTTKAIIVLNRDQRVARAVTMTDEQILRQSKAACEQCQKCTDLCPRDLLGHKVKPHLLMRVANYGIKDFEGMKRSLLCSECGVCDLYACPAGLSPRRVNMLVKQQLSEVGIKADKAVQVSTASEIFPYRKVPVKRLIQRLGLGAFDRPAPLKEVSFAPSRVSLLLKQHLGAPAIPTVQTGDAVNKGDLVGRMADDKLGAHIHASISGTVTRVTETMVVIEKDS